MNIGRVKYAGFWRRFGAALLDGLLFNSFIFLLLYGLYGSEYLNWAMSQDNGGRWFYTPLEAVINYLLFPAVVIFLWVRFCATPGKMLMGCRVVDAETGNPLRASQAALRYLGYIVSTLPLFLGFFWVIWDRRKQGFHDKIAHSVVVIEDEADRLLQQWRDQQ